MLLSQSPGGSRKGEATRAGPQVTLAKRAGDAVRGGGRKRLVDTRGWHWPAPGLLEAGEVSTAENIDQSPVIV